MKILCFIRSIIVCFTIFSFFTAKSQDAGVKFYDVIDQDSVVMYFSDSYNFTWKNCAENRRYTKIDSLGDFYKSFIDIDANNTIMAKGYYYDGVKNGYFETFHSNGRLKSKGNFKDHLPVGTWNYFYEDGKPERELLISSVDTFLIQFYDEQGGHTVIDGNGKFNGLVAASDRFFNTRIIASGKIVNGKADGEWKSYIRTVPYCTETFDKGVFLHGQYTSLVEKSKKYTNRSYLKNIFIDSYIESLEQFRVTECPFSKIVDTSREIERPKVNTELNLDHFRSYVNDAISRVIDNDVRNGNYRDYQPGDNFFKISFTVNDAGTPVNFKRLTSWGDQYFNLITNVLTRHAKIPTTTRLIYFHLTVTRSESNSIGYRFNLSYDDQQ